MRRWWRPRIPAKRCNARAVAARLSAIQPRPVGTRQAACAAQFGLSEDELDDPTFDLLGKLGFSTDEVAAANSYCCGGTPPDRLIGLQPEHRAIFACLNADGEGGIAPEALLTMTAALLTVQRNCHGVYAFP